MFYNDLTLLTDFYELTMMQGYYLAGTSQKIVVFDLFYRTNPSGNGYSITAGLAQAIEYVKSLKFSDDDISYLRSLGTFKEEFLEYLKNYKFTGDIYAVPEGTVVFPQEPLMRIKGPVIEAQLMESALLNIINHQSLIATKAARVCEAAGDDRVLEFGLRRAQGPDAGIYGGRAAIIGGCHATSNVLCGKAFDVPVSGTHAHSWIMSFEDELEAFRKYAEIYSENCILLVDTYDTLKSGIPNAIKVFQELQEQGRLKIHGIRLDSGDLAYLSKKVRIMLDEAGFPDAIISASSDLDENLILNLKLQGAKITLWGVGTNLITSKDSPAFGGVYKLVGELNDRGEMVPKIKLSENPEKITNPGEKTVFRIYDKKSGKVKADLISLVGETIDTTKDLTIFHPINTWKKMTLKANEYYVEDLLVPVFVKGECVYESPSVLEIRDYCKKSLNSFWEEYKRLVNPQILPVDLSLPLYTLKSKMIQDIRRQ
ncbi:nicotinate phosphoribosyltransferase [Anaeropeptidivorans aminofermentans]|uniref:nicotinate phosphoribosyltransferase n=1 Tax=Anaeropeptidivorans aminofermentans TaxID=2934315 RepID=UPI002023EC03|nr:nicotinate phosphoribosyltransferase [Anaeropeptidivorans aminofermentans]